MIDHISIGVADLARSKRFYDAAMAPLAYRCLSEDDASLGYGDANAQFWTYAAERPVPPDPKSGLHVCFVAPTRAAVDAFHQAALATGGKDNGKPGLRTSYGPNYYAAFVIDPDGYRIEAYCAKPG
jgi:catechol 2,3-dioxygenase-like lactoylglutathione lyase family enzyme